MHKATNHNPRKGVNLGLKKMWHTFYAPTPVTFSSWMTKYLDVQFISFYMPRSLTFWDPFPNNYLRKISPYTP